ncbi:MAG: hypothetical protein AMS18_10015 [Gemmatimonas sp. SG8_17]|nr:MAG: hypothetical protein AMS18_10015 [Gemmatimonas sp. SG8_17]
MLSSEEAVGRNVKYGVIGCPVCKAEYPIENGTVRFGVDPLLGSDSRSDDLTLEETLEPETVQALLSLESGGGYIVLLGSATRVSGPLAHLAPGIQHIGINPPPDVSESPGLSLLQATADIPLRSAVARGVVVGKEYAVAPWLTEAVRVLADSMRLLVADERALVTGAECLATETGVWVGVKTGLR